MEEIENMTTHKCYYCGKIINSDRISLNVKVRNIIYPVCSDICKNDANRFLSKILTD